MARRQRAKNSSAGCPEDTSESGVDASRRQQDLLSGVQQQLEKLKAAPLAPGLYIVSTPIGNLGDISIRALFTLAAADMVVCEDTRHSRKLFSAFRIGRKLETYHDFSGEKDRERILGALREGRSVALISDAGTPLVADPGFKLVRAAVAEGFRVFPLPGPSALLSALVASGLPSDQFFFGGFLPPKETARREILEAFRDVPGTLIVYETPSRIEATLTACSTIFPDRQITLARELTKIHEGFARGTAETLLEKIKETPLLGEVVVLIGPGERPQAQDADLEDALRKAMQRLSLREAVEEVAKGLGAGKKKVYNLALRLKGHSL
jgi:16S rRNA (cytidine1402-2'-O)-methyltransferase